MTDFQKVSKYVKDDLGIDVKMGQITAFMGHKNKTIFIHHNHNLKKNGLYTLLHEVGHLIKINMKTILNKLMRINPQKSLICTNS